MRRFWSGSAARAFGAPGRDRSPAERVRARSWWWWCAVAGYAKGALGAMLTCSPALVPACLLLSTSSPRSDPQNPKPPVGMVWVHGCVSPQGWMRARSVPVRACGCLCVCVCARACAVAAESEPRPPGPDGSLYTISLIPSAALKRWGFCLLLWLDGSLRGAGNT